MFGILRLLRLFLMLELYPFHASFLSLTSTCMSFTLTSTLIPELALPFFTTNLIYSY